MNVLPKRAEMDRAMLGSDRAYDGVFFTAVRTTGVFCRPSCRARKPKPQNVEYFASVRDALLNGYRPCKRCRPLDISGRPPDWIETLLTRIGRAPRERLTDRDLRALNVEPTRVRRYFLHRYGVTFQAYHRALRMGLALEDLKGGNDNMQVAMNLGYESLSGFRDAFRQTFRSPPGSCEIVGSVVTRNIRTPIGPLVAGATETGVCLLEFADRPALPRQISTIRKRLSSVLVPGNSRHLDQLEQELDEYFRKSRTEFTVPLELPGTPFQEAVWAKLREIPYGTTCSYAQLARAAGRPGAQRAVGRTNGDNRVAIVVPCHRVVQSNGQLRGYGGGLWRKKFLLDLERDRQDRGH